MPLGEAPQISIISSLWRENDQWLERCIKSILSQTMSDFEWIIVNDGATESNLKILESFANTDERIKIIHNSQNLGLTRSLNKAAQYVKGEYIARMDTDDFCDPKRFEIQLDFMKKNPKVVLCGHAYNEIDEKGQLKDASVPFVQSDLDIRKAIRSFNPLAHPTFFMRATHFKEIGGYDESFPFAQDYELLSRMIDQGEVVNLPQKLLTRTMAKGRISSAKNKEQRRCAMRVTGRLIKKQGPTVQSLWSLFKSIIKVTF